MYNIAELNSMSDDQIVVVAKELGIKNAAKIERQKLVYEILDLFFVRHLRDQSARFQFVKNCHFF